MMKTLEIIKDKIKDCNSCHLKNNKILPCSGIGEESDIMIVLDYPSNEEGLTSDPLDSRPGIYFKKLLEIANISNAYITFAIKCKPIKASDKSPNICNYWLINEIDLVKPKIIISFGQTANKCLKNIEHLSWHSIEHLLKSGKKVEEETINFLKEVRNKYE